MKIGSALGRFWKQLSSSEGPPAAGFIGSSDPLGEWILPWCRLLNAFPEIEGTLAICEAASKHGQGLQGRWIYVPGHAGYILSEGDVGRCSINLPPGVNAEDVVELQVDTEGCTPGKDQLSSFIANIELTISAGRPSSAARLLAPARQLLDWTRSAMACDQRIDAIVRDGLQRISPLERSDKLSPGKLTCQEAALDGLLNTLAKDVDACYRRFVFAEPMLSVDASPIAIDFWNRFPHFAVNGPIYADVLVLCGLCLTMKGNANSPAQVQGMFNDETLMALLDVMKACQPGKRAWGMAVIAVVRAVKQGREDDLLTVIESLQDKGEQQINTALESTSTDHGLYFDLLYSAVPPLRAAHEIAQLVAEAHGIDSSFGTEFFRSYIAKARHAIEEKVVRLSDSLISDAEDIGGTSFANHRKSVLDKLASSGSTAAELEAAHYTTHSLLYPRSLEPYLLGRKDNLNWKATWNLRK